MAALTGGSSLDFGGLAKSRPCIGSGGRLIFVSVFIIILVSFLRGDLYVTRAARPLGAYRGIQWGGHARLRFNIPLKGQRADTSNAFYFSCRK